MNSTLGEKVNLMCNLSDLVEERGEHNKLRKQVEKKLLKGIPVEEIAEALEETVEVIQLIISEMQVKI